MTNRPAPAGKRALASTAAGGQQEAAMSGGGRSGMGVPPMSSEAGLATPDATPETIRLTYVRFHPRNNRA